MPTRSAVGYHWLSRGRELAFGIKVDATRWFLRRCRPTGNSRSMNADKNIERNEASDDAASSEIGQPKPGAAASKDAQMKEDSSARKVKREQEAAKIWP
jgi:hypothetical protein